MTRTLISLVVCLALLCLASPAKAGSWVFRRSYYSHHPVTPVQVGVPTARGPYYVRPAGGYYNGGFRYLRSNIVIRGQIFDSLNVYESWGQAGAQF